MSQQEDEQRQLEAVRRDLHRRFEALEQHEVDSRFEAVVAGFVDAPIRTFVPVLTRRIVSEQLSRLRGPEC